METQINSFTESCSVFSSKASLSPSQTCKTLASASTRDSESKSPAIFSKAMNQCFHLLAKRFFWLCLLLIAPTIASAQVTQYELMRVAKVEVIPEGRPAGSEFDAGAVRSRLQTKPGNFFSQAEFDQDLKMLSEEYDRVEPSLQTVGSELYITLRIWTKPTVQSVIFCGNERVTTKRLGKTLGIKPGDIFEREEFLKAFNKLKYFYIKKGYFEAHVSFDITPIPGCNEVEIKICIEEGRAGRIKKICFYGFDAYEENEILDDMLTKKFNLLLSWYTGRGCYHPEMIEHDRLTILHFLQNEGYADATVSIKIEECPSDNRIALIICAEKGQCYSIGSLCIGGNTLFPDQQIWKQFLFGPGSIYSPEDIRCTIDNIRKLYGACGYIDAAVDVQLSLHDDCPIYDVTFSIDEGEKYCVGMIHVFGNTCTQTKVVLNESLLCPGEVFDIRKLEGTEERLRNTGYFCNVNVYAVKSQDSRCEDAHHRDVYIEVEETDTGNVGLFLGFSSLDRLFGGVEISEQNFNIMGIPHILNHGPKVLRGAGEYVHLKTNIGDKQTSYLAQWTKPYFLDTPWIVGFDVERSNNRALSEAYTLKTWGGNVHATYICNDYLKYDVFYRAQHTRVKVRGDETDALEEQGVNSGFISAVGNALIYDSTNHPRYPTAGFRSRLVYELAGVGGNYEFMKFAYWNSYYFPLSKRGTFKFRADFTFVHVWGGTNFNKLPLSERLYLGGETTVRGYRPFIIGPKFANNQPSGGLSSYLLSEEYQYNILDTPRFDAFAFIDAGFVSQSEFTIGRQAASTGFGIRIEVMRNMPLMLGLGWPIHPGERLSNGDHQNNAKRFFFAVGGAF